MTTTTATHETAYPRQPALRVRLRAAIHGRALDRRLLAGESPEASPELSRRVEHLLDLRERRELATGLRLTVDATLSPIHEPSSRVSLNEVEVRAARERLLELADALEGEGPVHVRGVILARVLLTDLASPLYSRCPSGALDEAAGHARAALLLG